MESSIFVDYKYQISIFIMIIIFFSALFLYKLKDIENNMTNLLRKTITYNVMFVSSLFTYKIIIPNTSLLDLVFDLFKFLTFSDLFLFKQNQRSN